MSHVFIVISNRSCTCWWAWKSSLSNEAMFVIFFLSKAKKEKKILSWNQLMIVFSVPYSTSIELAGSLNSALCVGVEWCFFCCALAVTVATTAYRMLFIPVLWQWNEFEELCLRPNYVWIQPNKAIRFLPLWHDILMSSNDNNQ